MGLGIPEARDVSGGPGRCRIIFGEADAFPGLTVDKFHDLLSVQVLSVGMERIKGMLLPALVEILRQDGAGHPWRL